MVRKIMGASRSRSSATPSPSPQPKPTPPRARNAGSTIQRPTPQRQAKAPVQRQAPAPSNQRQQGSWMGSGLPSSYSSMSSSDMGGGAPPVVAAPSDEDYLSGDAGYQTQLSALQGALQRYLADADFQRNNYNTDYTRSLRDLGYDEGTKAWNWNDELTASGRGYQNQLDDFGARGMLQSSGYADAFQELQRMLGQQYDAMSSAKGTFMTDLNNQTANYRAENTASQQAARAEALARRAAQYGL